MKIKRFKVSRVVEEQQVRRLLASTVPCDLP